MRHARTRRLAAFIVAVGLLASLAAATPVLAATIVVNTMADNTTDDDLCSLREAITTANDDTPIGAGGAGNDCVTGAGPDTITFSATGTITLTSALPAISSDVSIDGAGAITVNGASAHQVFNISATGTGTLAGLTITGGVAPFGGGVNIGGTLTVTNSTISGNTATLDGAGILNTGMLTVISSTISGNTAVGGTIAGNGGGIVNLGALTVSDSTISGNTATGGMFGSGAGGGINNFGALTIDNSTISGNTADVFGGGVVNSGGTLTLTNSTVSGNTAGSAAGGIFALGVDTLVNTIVVGNSSDVEGPVETATTNVIGVPVGLTLADILDPDGLADNGGPTHTIALALVAGNPAIDTATSAVCSAAPVSGVDQRGMPRPAACDRGAYEAQPPTVAAHANVSAIATSAAGAVVTYTAPAGTDEQDGTAAVACLPASGSTFAVGSTPVTCTATDAVGHTGIGSFQVVVGALGAATPTPALLPNTAAGAGTAGASGLTTAIAAVSLVSLALLARATRKGSRR